MGTFMFGFTVAVFLCCCIAFIWKDTLLEIIEKEDKK